VRLLNKTSNPVFTGYFWDGPEDAQSKLTVRGIFIKTVFSLTIITCIIVGIWKLYSAGTNIKWYTTGGMLAGIIISLIISVRRHWAHILVPLYAVAKGFMLGGITAYAHDKFPNMPYQAVGVTIITFL